MKVLFLFLFIIPVISYGQDSIPVGYGPEDIVLDTTNGKERIIVSCNDWRKEGRTPGIWSVDLISGRTRALTLRFADNQIVLWPHGIDLANGHLFVVNHIEKEDPVNLGKKRRERISHEILEFNLKEDTLTLVKAHRHRLMKSPNDVFAISRDEVYWSNFRFFGGNVCRIRNGNAEVVHRKGRMQNGVHVIKTVGSEPKAYLLTSNTWGRKVLRTNLSDNFKTTTIGKVKGGDNFTQLSDSTLLLTGHTRFFKFIRHAMNNKHTSPSAVFLIDVNKHKKCQSKIHTDNGSGISACSTAIMFRKVLYMAQIFEPYLLVVPATKLTP